MLTSSTRENDFISEEGQYNQLFDSGVGTRAPRESNCPIMWSHFGKDNVCLQKDVNFGNKAEVQEDRFYSLRSLPV